MSKNKKDIVPRVKINYSVLEAAREAQGTNNDRSNSDYNITYEMKKTHEEATGRDEF